MDAVTRTSLNGENKTMKALLTIVHTMSKVLTLPVKAVYFFEIQSGYKTEEYRLCTPYWGKRLENRDYFGVEITLGYPPRDCTERRIFFPWRGFRKTTIIHPHFGTEPVLVYAIRLAKGRRLG